MSTILCSVLLGEDCNSPWGFLTWFENRNYKIHTPLVDYLAGLGDFIDPAGTKFYWTQPILL